MRAFGIELKREIKKVVPFFLVFLILSIVLTQNGIIKIKAIYEEEKEFQKLENQLVNGYISYHQYAAYGMRLKYSPKQISALFVETSPFLDITAFIDIGFKLYLYKEIFSNNAVAQKGYLDTSWFLKIIGSFLVLIWGWKTFRDKDYLKFLISKHGKRVKPEILMSRIAIIFLGVLVIYGQILIQFVINGHSIDAGNVGVFLWVVFLVYVIWFSFAAFMGTESTRNKKILTAVIWITLVMILPEGVRFYFDKAAKSMIKCKYVHESKKADIVKQVEKEALAKSERYPYKEQKFKSDVESAKRFLNIQRKEIDSLEKQVITLSERVVRNYQFISTLNFMTFLQSTEWEVSSQGYNGFLKFHKYMLEVQRNFLKHIYDKLYFKAPYYGPVKPFLKNEETIFRFKSELPDFFWFGVMWCLAIIFLLMWSNCWKLDKVLFKDEREKINDLELILSGGEKNVLLSGYKPLRQHIYNSFIGEAELKGKLTTMKSKEVNGSLYLYKKTKMDARFTPDEMRKLLNEQGEKIEGRENWEILFTHAKKENRVLILMDFFEGCKNKEIKKIVEFIKINKLLALIITNNTHLACWLVPAEKILLMTGDETVSLN